jgi:Tfp pilus assembly protein PilO
MLNFSGTTKRPLTVLIIVNIFLAVVSVYVFLVIRSNGRAVSSLKNSIQLELDREAKLKTMKEAVDATKDDRAKIDSFFIKKIDLISFIESVESLGKTTGAAVTIKAVNSSADPDNQAAIYENLTMNVSVDGSWNQLYRFTALIESMPAAFSLGGVHFARNKDLADSGKIKSANAAPWSGSFEIKAKALKQ